MNIKDIKNLCAGDEVFWEDPDNGKCSYSLIISDIEIDGDVIKIIDKDGGYLECFANELH
jgi:hypothetical protein